MSARYDVVILGAGSGGYAAALRAADLGLSVALVEKDKVGGTCLHRGCIPTKALLHAAEVADSARDGAALGVHATVDKVDAPGLRSYADSVVTRLYRGLSGLLGSRGITVVAGEGRLVPGPDGVPAAEVGEEQLVGTALVLATGSVPRSLAGVDLDGTTVITSDSALRLDALPGSAVVLGGGVIGCEFASAWRSLGVEVTIVEALPRLVPAEEPAVSAALARAFRRRGIAMRTSSPVRGVARTSTGVRVEVHGGDDLAADLVLVAVGRGPASGGLDLDRFGVRADRGYVLTDERLHTSVPGVYAVGDLVPGLQLAHRGFAHGLFVAEEVAFRTGRLDAPPVPVRDRDIPRITYSNPEIASVGLTEEQARAEFGEVETFTYDLAGNGRSVILGTSGFVRVVRRTDGPVLGVHMVGARVGELISEAQLVVGWEAFPTDVAPLLHPHPTQSEALGEAMLALSGKPLHVHG